MAEPGRMRRWLSRRFTWRRKQAISVSEARAVPPLREFVYLDEISLQSLLASQIGELKSEVTEMLSRADEAEITSSLSARTVAVNAELASRFQTTNSRGTQTSRKAVAQSLFKNFLELKDLDVALQPVHVNAMPSSLEELLDPDGHFAVSTDELTRGRLIEIDVELAADPIFRFSTTMAEYADLAKDYPDMAAGAGVADILEQSGPINKLLQRMLVGMIPLKSKALDLVLINHAGTDYLVHREAVESLGLESRHVSVVGVTEERAYWQDMRRVLFSGSKFTMLCRISRDGISDKWRPVKLVNVFAEVAPDLPDALEAASRISYTSPVIQPEGQQTIAFRTAAAHFVEKACQEWGFRPSGKFSSRLSALVDDLAPTNGTPSGQRIAFKRLAEFLKTESGKDFTPQEWLGLRRSSRAEAGLELLPPGGGGGTSEQAAPTRPESVDQEFLIDTEVIAIYW